MGLAVATRSWLLHLYPQSWRERYADEFTALLEDCALTPYTVFDVLLGAVVAWGLAVHNDVPAYLGSDTSPFHNPVSVHRSARLL